jgi:hypothetical protein
MEARTSLVRGVDATRDDEGLDREELALLRERTVRKARRVELHGRERVICPTTRQSGACRVDEIAFGGERR